MGGRIFHQTHWTPLLQMQGSVSEIKFELMRRDGTLVPIVMNAVRRSHEGSLVDDIAMFVARDRDTYERELVQSRKQLQTLVQQATQLQAESADRARFAEQMMGIVSHDLRNPLSTIQMGAAMLRRGDVTPAQLRVLERISRASERAARLTYDLLDFTQARLGKGIAISPVLLNLHEVVSEAVEELAQVNPGRELLHEPSGPSDGLADGDRIVQLVGNLVANAIAYGDPHTLVTVYSRVDESEIELGVHNFGPPIPPHKQGALFQPMMRGVAGGSAVRSVGLGLYIVGEIMHAHGGRVSVASAEGTGTTFTATFPRYGHGGGTRTVHS